MRSIRQGDPILAQLDVRREDLQPRPRADWTRGALVWRRPYRSAHQLRPSVWIADDLDAIVLSAAEAATTHDPVELPGSDGRVRRFVRCSADVWRVLRSRSVSPRLDRIRDLLAAVHGLPRLNAEAA